MNDKSEKDSRAPAAGSAKHTPGPWKMEASHHRVVVFTDEDEMDRIIVADVSLDDDDPHNTVALADGKLIAAAPALADALEDAVRSAAHEEACAWWEANISELRTEAQIAANDAKCDCWIGKARTALRAAGRLP